MDKRELLGGMSFGQRIAEEEIDDLASYFVETDHWRRLYSGAIDIVYGPKGSGKSALYSLLIARTEDLFDGNVILAPAENPRGAPAFKDLVTDPPASEFEFIGLWKLYFACILSDVLDEYGVGGTHAKRLHLALEAEGLVRRGRSLQALLKGALDYVRQAIRPSSVEGGVAVDPVSQLPVGFTGKITFREPSAEAKATGLSSIDALLELGDQALRDNGDFKLWLLLDRLDVAFAETPELEQNALRALFRVYLDLLGFTNIAVKIFLRSDIWHRITSGGFREASHIARHMTIDWNRNSLLNLIVRRVMHNANVQEYYGDIPDSVLQTPQKQEKFFYRMFPDQVDVGPNKPSAFDWMLIRTRDGTAKNAPRELIHLLNSLRDVQMRRLEYGEREPDEEVLFSRGAFKEALVEVSQIRLTQTLYAEYPSLRASLEELRGAKTLQRPVTLSKIWGLSDAETAKRAQELVDVGFFEQRGTRDSPEYWVPFLYRDALQLVQGTAE